MSSGNPRRARPLLAALLAFAASAPAYVGQWHGFADKSRVTALIGHQGFVYAGTHGGIRRVHPGTLAQRDFGNLDGLIDPWITGLARDSAGRLWAVARDGYVYALAGNGNRWDIHGRGYAAGQWKMNDRAVLAAGSHLYLGSEKGLALFDTELKVSQLDLKRFGSDMDVPVLSLLRRGDTLYAGTSAGVYKARVYFADPLNPPSGYANLADHNQWIKAAFPPDPDRRFDHLAFIGDSLATYGPGTLLQAPQDAPVRVEAFSGEPLVIGDQTRPADWNDFVAAASAGGKLFAGGDTRLAVWQDPAAAPDTLLAPLKAHPRDTIANIGANNGVVWGHSPSGLQRFEPPQGTFTFRSSGVNVNPPGSQEELYVRFLRNVVVDADGDVYVGSWGGGLVRVRGGVSQTWRNEAAVAGSCLYAPDPLDSFTVIHALSRPRNGGLFLGIPRGNEQDHQLAYFNTAMATVFCPAEGLVVEGGYPHAVQAFSDTLLGIATEVGLVLFKTREGPGAPQLEPQGLWRIPGGANEAWDLAVDQWSRPWILIGGGIARLDLDSLGVSTAKSLVPIDNFIGESCRSLESDPAGFLWVGCVNGLFHVQTGASGELAKVRPYGLDDGLPSLFIFDVSVDPADGRVWVATDRGVGMFESPSQPPVPKGGLAVVVPYPNPFRPNHPFVFFDGLPRDATLRIHDPSGVVVRVFHPRDRARTGNQAQWDGKNERGRAVAPGVYLFSVTSGSTVQRGKVIVAR